MTTVVLTGLGRRQPGVRGPIVARAAVEGDRIVIRQPGRRLPAAIITESLWSALVARGLLSGAKPQGNQ